MPIVDHPTTVLLAVPLMTFDAERGMADLVPYYEKMGEERVKAYWQRKNSKTIDGQPTGI